MASRKRSRRRLSQLVTAFCLGIGVCAEDWNCHASVGSQTFDLSPLQGVHQLTVSQATPPTTTNVGAQWEDFR